MMQTFAYGTDSGTGSEKDSQSVDGNHILGVGSPQVNVDEEVLYNEGPGPLITASQAGLPPTQAFNDADEGVTTVSSRAYQLEMLDQSLQRNVIVSVSEQMKQATAHPRPQLPILRG